MNEYKGLLIAFSAGIIGVRVKLMWKETALKNVTLIPIIIL